MKTYPYAALLAGTALLSACAKSTNEILAQYISPMQHTPC